MGAGGVMEPLYVCVYVPEFPAQALLRLRPELARDPIAVVDGDPPLEQVCSFNTNATRVGLTQGMTRPELEGIAGLRVMKRSEQEERTTRSALLEVAGTFTPRIEVQPSSQSNCVLVLDMTGSTRIFGQAQELLGRISQSIKGLRLHAQLAASANLHTAVCMAAFVRKAHVLIPSGEEATHLSRLPLAALPLTVPQAETFSLWGLLNLGELANVPEVELIVRLGQQGRKLRSMARGEYPHLMVPEEPVFALEEFVSLDAPLEILESLLFLLGPMLDQLLMRAQNRVFALASVTVRLGLDGGGTHERTIKPALPVAQREVLLKLLHLDLQAHPPPAGVVHVFVHAEPGDRSKVQFGLFAPQLPEPLRLDVTLARIAALVGERRVGRARLLDTHRPDSFAMERFMVPGVATGEREKPSAAVVLRRCRPPVPVTVQHEGHQPAAVYLRGKRYTVQEAYGPWRRSGEWWSASVWSHEEWDVHAIDSVPESNKEESLLCVLTHDLLRSHWELEALYD